MKVRTALVAIATMAAVAGFAQSAMAVTNGHADRNRHPWVGALVSHDPETGEKYLICSGTLIAPELFLTAAHCLEDEPSDLDVSFDAFVGAPDVGPDVRLHHGQAYGDPEFAGNTEGPGDTHDLAVVVLDQAVRGIRPVKLPRVGALDRIERALPHLRQVIVGYGREGHDGDGFFGGGGRRFGVGRWLSLDGYTFELDQGDHLGGSCNGDSGGPVFVGNTRLEIGVVVDGDEFCQENSINVRLDTESAHAFLDPFLRGEVPGEDQEEE